MNKLLKNLIWLLALCLMGNTLAAQEKIDEISPKSKEAREKLKNAPAAVGQSIGQGLQGLQDMGKAVASKLGLATKETKVSPAAGSDAAPIPEQKAVAVPQARGQPVARRDPFRPFTLTTRAAAPARKRDNLSPLERFEIGQLTLVGVVADAKNANALVEDSSGLGYVVKIGTPIGTNDGKVIAIRRERIVIEESYVDFYGVQKKREVNMKLTSESAE